MNEYRGDFETRADVEKAFRTKIGTDVQILWASYHIEDYEGAAWVLCTQNGILLEVCGSHCSCMGLEEQWDLQPTTVEALMWAHQRGDRLEGHITEAELLAVLANAGWSVDAENARQVTPERVDAMSIEQITAWAESVWSPITVVYCPIRTRAKGYPCNAAWLECAIPPGQQMSIGASGTAYPAVSKDFWYDTSDTGYRVLAKAILKRQEQRMADAHTPESSLRFVFDAPFSHADMGSASVAYIEGKTP